MKNKYRHDSTTYFEFQTFETKQRLVFLKTKSHLTICHNDTKRGHDEKLNPQDLSSISSSTVLELKGSTFKGSGCT